MGDCSGNKGGLLMGMQSQQNLIFKIRSVCPCSSVCATVSASINPLYPATDCAAATDVSDVSGSWQLSR